MIACPVWNEIRGRTILSGQIGTLLLLAACAAVPPQHESTTQTATPVPQAAVTPAAAPLPVAAQPQHEVVSTPVATAANPSSVHAPKAVTTAPAPKPAIVKIPAIAASVKSTPAPASSVPAEFSLSGTLILQTQAGQSATSADMTDSVIYFRPASGAARPHPGHYQMYTHDSQFDPRTLIVPVGSTVNFPNQDHILHNVFSVSPVATFDLGYYGLGGNGQYTFTKPGVALVYCNVHSSMQADVLILDTPYYTHPNRNGRFTLSGLPAGAGTLWVWNPRADAHSVAATAPSANLKLELTLARPLLSQHVNKERRAY